MLLYQVLSNSEYISSSVFSVADSEEVWGPQWWWCELCGFHPGHRWGVYWTGHGDRKREVRIHKS